MDKLVVMYSVDRNNPTNTWSGTSYALTEAISKYVEVIKIDLYQGIFLRTLRKLSHNSKERLNWMMGEKFFGKLYDKALQNKAKLLTSKYKGIPVLQIANDVLIPGEFYIYQDLSYAVLKRRINNLKDSLQESSGGAAINLSESELNRRIRVQEREYYSARKIFFMGNWVTSEMKNIYPDIEYKFHTVGGGVNKELVGRKSVDKRENAILFIGRDFQRKGGDLVIKAFEILQRKYPDLQSKLYIAGDVNGNKYRHIKGVNILGSIDRKQLREYFNKSKLFCMPSRFEAYGLVFPEAFSFGVPCIGRNDYEMPYFIENNKTGLLLEDDDPHILSSMMYRLLTDDSFMQEVSNKKEYYNKIYNWDNVAEKIVNHIKSN